MKVTISPSVACGSVLPPNSKSIAHRYLILAAMANGTSKIEGVPNCEDVSATLACLKNLGVKIKQKKNTVWIEGKDFFRLSPTAPLPCGESGSTLRFLIPLVSLCEKEVVFKGAKSLFQRPLSIYEKIFTEQNKTFIFIKDTLTVCGTLSAGSYTLAGDISSQFVTGLFFALPLLQGESEVILFPPVESRPYIELTLQALGKFGIRIREISPNHWKISGGQRPAAQNLLVEADESAAAFFGALNFLGGDVTIEGLSQNTKQGDRVWKKSFEILKQEHPILSLADCPDLAPILFAMAAERGAVFTHISRLRLKESDRVESMVAELEKCGAEAVIENHQVVFLPSSLHPPKTDLQGHNDHRVVMALSILLSRLGGSISGAEAVAKSYPRFFEDLKQVGITCNIEEKGEPK